MNSTRHCQRGFSRLRNYHSFSKLPSAQKLLNGALSLPLSERMSLFNVWLQMAFLRLPSINHRWVDPWLGLMQEVFMSYWEQEKQNHALANTYESVRLLRHILLEPRGCLRRNTALALLFKGTGKFCWCAFITVDESVGAALILVGNVPRWNAWVQFQAQDPDSSFLGANRVAEFLPPVWDTGNVFSAPRSICRHLGSESVSRNSLTYSPSSKLLFWKIS